jgi:hypothetical protein
VRLMRGRRLAPRRRRRHHGEPRASLSSTLALTRGEHRSRGQALRAHSGALTMPPRFSMSPCRSECRIPVMVRPESCVVLAGESPAAVSAGAPRSRARSNGEIRRAERAVESPQGIARSPGGEQRRGPSIKRTLQPREISPRKGGVAEPIMTRRRQQTASGRTGGMQDAPGVGRRARAESTTRNRRGPTRRLTSSEGWPYKPRAKGAGAGRESEGLVVPMRTVTTTPSEERSPALVALVSGGKHEGMAR